MVWDVREEVQLVVSPHGQLFPERVVSFGNITSVDHIRFLVSK